MAKSPKQGPRWQSNGPRIQHQEREDKGSAGKRNLMLKECCLLVKTRSSLCFQLAGKNCSLLDVSMCLDTDLETGKQSQHRAFNLFWQSRF